MTPEPMSEFLAAMLAAESAGPGYAEPGTGLGAQSRSLDTSVETKPASGRQTGETACPTRSQHWQRTAEEMANLQSLDTSVETADSATSLETDACEELERLIASIESEVGQTPLDRSPRAPVADEEKPEVFIVVVLAGSQYAIPIRQTREMDVLPPVTPLPFVPDWIRGVTNRRGDVLAVVDLRSLLNLEAGGGPGGGRIVVVAAGDGQQAAALVVDEVRGTVNMPRKSFAKPGGPMSDRSASTLSGVSEYQNQLLGLLDIEKVLRAAAANQAG